ncbi:o-succinylbenzoate-CoA ligase [Terfezia boudieri ATCC MYA-4762]|uniref:O-succinylbenzoate-CoA ligase n=1 Tax=Terfezia boudieri ATCC MYA-4762 TaxID=1051890 RepID=A0A3N4M022_9PEZI|nr:o-succinylbenzoate-CoA ligase [Terfezia boudieri ATCC MYA-4762]
MTSSTLITAIAAPSTQPAVIIPPLDLTLTYSHLHDLITKFQHSLAAIGISPNDAVSISLPNTLEFIVIFLAVGAQRAIAAPLNPNYKQEEFEFYIDDLKSKLVIIPRRGDVGMDSPAARAARRFGAGVAEVWWDGQEVKIEAKEEDVALVLHTSGTTGRPKAVPLTHKNLTTTMYNIQATYELAPEDRTMLVMPLFHVHGLLAGFLAPLRSGGTVVVPPRFSASEFWKDFIKYKANWYTAVPTIHQILLKNTLPSPVPRIRFIRSCSSPLSPATFEALEKALNAPVLEAYAMTEAAHQMTSNPLPTNGPRYPGSVGKGMGVSVRILDDKGNELPHDTQGEICIRGPNVTSGYINNPAANVSSFYPNGYFRTGDMGTIDAAGYVRITGRIKEMINRGGEKIAPVELDNVLASHPAVAEAVCFALESELYGQEVGAAVVLKEGKKVSEGELKGWLGERVVKFKVPKRVWFTEVMPKTATGKVQRRMVAEEMVKSNQKAKL